MIEELLELKELNDDRIEEPIKETLYQVNVDGEDMGTFDNEEDAYREKDNLNNPKAKVVELDGEFDDEDDDNYDRRAVEQEYDLEDGELDGVSIRDAEDMVDEEEGALDRFIFQDEALKEQSELSKDHKIVDSPKGDSWVVDDTYEITKNYGTVYWWDEVKAKEFPQWIFNVAKKLLDNSETLKESKLNEEETIDDNNAIDYSNLIDEFVKTSSIFNDDGEYELYADYDDYLGDEDVAAIIDSDSPDEKFYHMFDYIFLGDEDDYIIDEFNEFLNKKGVPEISREDFFDADLHSHYTIVPNYAHYLNQEYKCRIIIDTGDGNYDYTLNPSYYNGYKGASEDDSEHIGKPASLVWLAETQGYSLEDLRNALEDGDIKDPKGFLQSVRQEAVNTTTGMNALVVLCRATLGELIKAKQNKCNITIKGNGCNIGLVDIWNGGGSVLEIQLEKPITIPFEYIREFTTDVDKHHTYSIDGIYGLSGKCYDERPVLNCETNESLKESAKREYVNAEDATNHVVEEKGKITILGKDGMLGSDFYFENGNIVAYNFELGPVPRTPEEFSKEDLLKHLKKLERYGFKFIKSDNIKDTRRLHINNTYEVESLKGNKMKRNLKEAQDVTDQVIIKTNEPGFLTKKRELQDKGYSVLWTGEGKICMAKPKALKENTENKRAYFTDGETVLCIDSKDKVFTDMPFSETFEREDVKRVTKDVINEIRRTYIQAGWGNNWYGGMFEACSSKKSNRLNERNLTRAERANRDMERIFDNYRKENEQIAKFLLDKGVSAEEVEELKKNTGLGKNALDDKLSELGIRDEYWETYHKDFMDRQREINKMIYGEACSRKSKKRALKEEAEDELSELKKVAKAYQEDLKEIGTDYEKASAYIDDVLDWDISIDSKKDYNSAKIWVGLGGPNVCLDTDDAMIKVYWGGKKYEEPYSYDTNDVLDEIMSEIYYTVTYNESLSQEEKDYQNKFADDAIKGHKDALKQAKKIGADKDVRKAINKHIKDWKDFKKGINEEYSGEEKITEVEEKAKEAVDPAFAKALRDRAQFNKTRIKKVDADMENAKNKDFQIGKEKKLSLDESLFQVK